MKAIAGYLVAFAFFSVLAPSVSAQKSSRGDRTQNGDVGSSPILGPILGWNDAIPVQPTPSLAHAPQPLRPVSVNELRIPPKAIKELQRSRKAFDGHDFQTSTEHLEKALNIYPQFYEAHYDLGVNFMQLGEYQKASAEYQKALEIDPTRPQAYNGLSIAFSALARYREAEASSRRALELDPESPDYRYMLGRSIVAQGRFTPEALALLHQSESKFPQAALIRAQVLLYEGKVDNAVAELRTFLNSGELQNKEEAECWLALLNGVATGACAAQKTFPAFR